MKPQASIGAVLAEAAIGVMDEALMLGDGGGVKTGEGGGVEKSGATTGMGPNIASTYASVVVGIVVEMGSTGFGTLGVATTFE